MKNPRKIDVPTHAKMQVFDKKQAKKQAKRTIFTISATQLFLNENCSNICNIFSINWYRDLKVIFENNDRNKIYLLKKVCTPFSGVLIVIMCYCLDVV